MKTVKQNGSKDMPSANITTHIGIVLAGGKSTRIGQDKTTLQWKGQSLLHHQYKTLSEAMPEGKVYVSGKAADLSSLADLNPGIGPLAGFESAFTILKNQGVLAVIPVDMPLLTPFTIQLLIHSLQNNDGVCFTDYELPLVINVNQKTSEILKQVLKSQESSQRSIYEFLSKLNVLKINPESRIKEELVNINYFSEYKKIHEAQYESAI